MSTSLHFQWYHDARGGRIATREQGAYLSKAFAVDLETSGHLFHIAFGSTLGGEGGTPQIAVASLYSQHAAAPAAAKGARPSWHWLAYHRRGAPDLRQFVDLGQWVNIQKFAELGSITADPKDIVEVGGRGAALVMSTITHTLGFERVGDLLRVDYPTTDEEGGITGVQPESFYRPPFGAKPRVAEEYAALKSLLFGGAGGKFEQFLTFAETTIGTYLTAAELATITLYRKSNRTPRAALLDTLMFKVIDSSHESGIFRPRPFRPQVLFLFLRSRAFPWRRVLEGALRIHEQRSALGKSSEGYPRLQRVNINEALSRNGFTVDGRLGRGAYGSVLAVTGPTGPAAVKHMRVNTTVLLVSWFAELEVHAAMARKQKSGSPPYAFFTQAIGPRTMVFGTHRFIVLHKYDRDLAEDIRRTRGPYPHTKQVLWNLLLATQALHHMSTEGAAGFIHRDIKPKNIMLSYTTEGLAAAALGDFGLSIRTDESPFITGRSTEGFWAPEIVPLRRNHDLTSSGKYGAAVDVYSIGVTFVMMATKIRPQGFRLPGLGKALSRVDDHHLVNLLIRMLKMDPRERITITQALKHAYFHDMSLAREAGRSLEAMEELQRRNTPRPGPPTHAGPLLHAMDLSRVMYVHVGGAGQWRLVPRPPPAPPAVIAAPATESVDESSLVSPMAWVPESLSLPPFPEIEIDDDDDDDDEAVDASLTPFSQRFPITSSREYPDVGNTAGLEESTPGVDSPSPLLEFTPITPTWTPGVDSPSPLLEFTPITPIWMPPFPSPNQSPMSAFTSDRYESPRRPSNAAHGFGWGSTPANRRSGRVTQTASLSQAFVGAAYHGEEDPASAAGGSDSLVIYANGTAMFGRRVKSMAEINVRVSDMDMVLKSQRVTDAAGAVVEFSYPTRSSMDNPNDLVKFSDVEVTAGPATKAPYNVSYTRRLAPWEIIYDVKLAEPPSGDPMQSVASKMTVWALVANDRVEDLNNMNIVLSSTYPNAAPTLLYQSQGTVTRHRPRRQASRGTREKGYYACEEREEGYEEEEEEEMAAGMGVGGGSASVAREKLVHSLQNVITEFPIGHYDIAKGESVKMVLKLYPATATMWDQWSSASGSKYAVKAVDLAVRGDSFVHRGVVRITQFKKEGAGGDRRLGEVEVEVLRAGERNFLPYARNAMIAIRHAKKSISTELDMESVSVTGSVVAARILHTARHTYTIVNHALPLSPPGSPTSGSVSRFRLLHHHSPSEWVLKTHGGGDADITHTAYHRGEHAPFEKTKPLVKVIEGPQVLELHLHIEKRNKVVIHQQRAEVLRFDVSSRWGRKDLLKRGGLVSYLNKGVDHVNGLFERYGGS